MKSRRFRVLGLLGACLGVAAFWWFQTPLPLSGGAQGDGFMARWVKNRVYAGISPREEAGFTRLTPENGNGWFAMSREPLQSFSYYQNQNPPRPTAARGTIVLQPLGDFDASQKQLLRALQKFCGAFFGLPVRLEAPISMPQNPAWRRPKTGKNSGPGRYQYRTAPLLSQVLAPHLPPDATAYLGITMDDLGAEGMSFVFGVGSVENRVGVYSLARYFPTRNCALTAPERAQGLRRSCQVLDHEMGHMLGLYHCVFYRCAMNGSNSLADADATPLDYCPLCLRKLEWNTGVERVSRYRKLLAFYREHGLQLEAKWAAQQLSSF